MLITNIKTALLRRCEVRNVYGVHNIEINRYYIYNACNATFTMRYATIATRIADNNERSRLIAIYDCRNNKHALLYMRMLTDCTTTFEIDCINRIYEFCSDNDNNGRIIYCGACDFELRNALLHSENSLQHDNNTINGIATYTDNNGNAMPHSNVVSFDSKEKIFL